MAVYKLDINECEDEAYDLLGIHTTLECYHLAYFLNRELNLLLKRIDFLPEFDFYEFNDLKNQTQWNLVANKGVREITQSSSVQESLFQLESTEVVYLVPEYKKVDYLVKVSQNTLEVQKLIAKMKVIPQIITTFAIDTSNLKSKHNLIFY